MSDSAQMDVITSKDIEGRDDIVKISEKDLEEYYAPIAREDMPDFSTVADDIISLLEFLNSDSDYNPESEVYKEMLIAKYPAPTMKVVINYILEGNPIDDLLDTIEMGSKIKSGQVEYEEGFSELQGRKQTQYVPEELRKLNQEYLEKGSIDELLDKKISRKSRRKIERIAKKMNKSKK